MVRGRHTVRKVISSCTACKKLDGRPYNAPPQPPLTDFRVSDEIAFTQVGVDFAGSSLKPLLSQHGIVWKFNVPRAPWWGGFFEWMVRSVKRCLKKTLGNARVTYEEFQTVLLEVEGILNSRPLTYVYEELEEPITPSSLCIGRRLLSPIPKTQDSISGTTATELSKRQKHLDLVLKHFWNRWRREYLSELREHHLDKIARRHHNLE